MLRTGKQTWKGQKSSWLKNGSKHQSRTDVFKLIWLSQGPHAIIHKQALKEGGQDYCGLIRPGSAIENHVETLEMHKMQRGLRAAAVSIQREVLV